MKLGWSNVEDPMLTERREQWTEAECLEAVESATFLEKGAMEMLTCWKAASAIELVVN